MVFMSSNTRLKKVKYALRFLPDKPYIQLYYFLQFRHFCHLRHPETYNEKLNWLKLHDHRPEYPGMVDKFEAKQYVADRIGEEYIIPTLGVWDTFNEIDFDTLPKQFVLKCTHDSEGIVIVKDKDTLDVDAAGEKLTRALNQNFYYIGREWAYKSIQPRIIAEQYMEDTKVGELRDYKFFCFDGVPRSLFVATGRTEDATCLDYFDMEFHHLDLRQKYPNATVHIEKPQQFDQMAQLAHILSQGYPHIRVDFYEVDGRVYFGELTLYNFSGFMPFQPDEWDKTWGDWLMLP